MSIFSFKKEEGASKPTKTKKVVSDLLPVKKVRAKGITKENTEKAITNTNKKTGASILSKDIIIKPIITEKAHFLSSFNTFTFEVLKGTNKKEVAEAIKTIYGFKPLKVAIIKVRNKKVFSRGKRGQTRSFNKAYVTLKYGDKINLV